VIANPEHFIGRRFACDLRVVSIAPGRPDDGDREVTVWMYGERATLSLEEFSGLVESGFLTEIEERGQI
jgi:hypothetical protein